MGLIEGNGVAQRLDWHGSVVCQSLSAIASSSRSIYWAIHGPPE